MGHMPKPSMLRTSSAFRRISSFLGELRAVDERTLGHAPDVLSEHQSQVGVAAEELVELSDARHGIGSDPVVGSQQHPSHVSVGGLNDSALEQLSRLDTVEPG